MKCWDSKLKAAVALERRIQFRNRDIGFSALAVLEVVGVPSICFMKGGTMKKKLRFNPAHNARCRIEAETRTVLRRVVLA